MRPTDDRSSNHNGESHLQCRHYKDPEPLRACQTAWPNEDPGQPNNATNQKRPVRRCEVGEEWPLTHCRTASTHTHQRQRVRIRHDRSKYCKERNHSDPTHAKDRTGTLQDAPPCIGPEALGAHRSHAAHHIDTGDSHRDGSGVLTLSHNSPAGRPLHTGDPPREAPACSHRQSGMCPPKSIRGRADQSPQSPDCPCRAR